MTARVIGREAAVASREAVWRGLASPERLALALAGMLLAGAGTHLVVGAQHSPSNFGSLSLLAGAAQAGLAVAVALRPSGAFHRGAIGLSVSLMTLWLLNVTVGLPLAISHSHIAGSHELWGFTLGWPGPLDGEGLVANLAQTGTIAFAAVLDRVRSSA